jgi:hypothetical protein
MQHSGAQQVAYASISKGAFLCVYFICIFLIMVWLTSTIHFLIINQVDDSHSERLQKDEPVECRYGKHKTVSLFFAHIPTFFEICG